MYKYTRGRDYRIYNEERWIVGVSVEIAVSDFYRVLINAYFLSEGQIINQQLL
jgi:hypothetical protein